MGTVLTFVSANWQFLSGVLALILGWFNVQEKFHTLFHKVEDKYIQARKFAKGKAIYKVAGTAYGVISKIARRTETTLDDKAEKGLLIAMDLMEKLGWDKEELNGEERDIVLKIFDQIHENEHLKLEAAHRSPVSNSASKAGEIAAPLG